MNVVPAQVAGVESARRRLAAAARSTAACRTRRCSRRARCSASTRCTRSAARRRSRCSRTARRGRARRSTWSPDRATSTSRRPSGTCKGVVGIDAEAGPTEIAVLADDTADPELRRRRPHRPGRARRAGRVPAGHARRRRCCDAVDAELARQVRRHAAPRAGRGGAGGRSRRRCSSTTSTHGLAVVDAWAAEHLEVHDRGRGGSGRAGCATPAPSSSARTRPVSLGDYLAGSNHVLPTGGTAAALRRPVGAVVPARHPRRRVRPRGAGAAVADRIAALGGAEDLAAHVAAVAVRVRERSRPRRRLAGPVGADRRRPTCGCRCATTCAGASPYGAPAARRPGPAEHQREPVPAARRAGRRPGRGGRWRSAATLNRYPDREAVALRDDLAALPRARPGGRRRSGPPTGRTRSSSSCCRPSAAPAAPRSGSSRPTRCTALIAAGHRHRLGATARRADDFSLDPDRAAVGTSPTCGPTSCSCARRTTRPATALPLGRGRGGLRRGPGHRRRRRGVRRVRPRRHRERARRCWPAGRGWS